MDGVRLILALHDHQPVGNFDGVFEAAYSDSYLPFLDVLEDYPEISFALHTSGPLVEWLEEKHPEYLARVKCLVEAGRVEILGGGFYEPILSMIPHRDRVGQIRDFTRYLEDIFATRIRGMWMPERVWEQSLTSALVEAGVEYTVLDDFHFQRTGLNDDELFGYYLTEDDGCLLKVFPICERLRYLIPFKEPHDSYEFLRGLSQRKPGAVAVFADDGEKFGTWPDTQKHVYKDGWLRRFCDMIRANGRWLETTTFASAVDQTLPLGKVYLPDSSYREMTEWVLPSTKFQAFMGLVQQTKNQANAETMKPFLRAGGFWRNFRAKYSESDEMYARMMTVSRRLDAVGKASQVGNSGEEPKGRMLSGGEEAVSMARQELYRGQCNCPYWHGAFGGLYLPHLRNAVFGSLIAADCAIDRALGREGVRVGIEVGDFNLDARQEVRLENDELVVFARPSMGGHVYELDVRRALVNVLATLQRRPEPYHDTIRAAARGETIDDGRATITEGVVFKQEGLERELVYDRHPRKALVDHFYAPKVRLEDLAACGDVERGDFVSGAYMATVERSKSHVQLNMERPGMADGHLIKVRKSIRLSAGSPMIEVSYELSDLPVGVPLHFAVELNLAAMAGNAPDRYYSDQEGKRLGTLDSRLDLKGTGGLLVTDEWLDLGIALTWTRPASLWCLPISTVSQSESGYESVYQSSSVQPRWLIVADESRRWVVGLTWTFGTAALELPSAGRVKPVHSATAMLTSSLAV